MRVHARPGSPSAASRAQRVRPEAGHHRLHLLGGDDGAEVGAAQVGDVLVGGEPHPDRAGDGRLGGPGPLVDGEGADEAQVHVHPAFALELEEQVLAAARGPQQLAAAHLRGPLGETSLRARDHGTAAGEGGVEVARQRVQGVALGHAGSLGAVLRARGDGHLPVRPVPGGWHGGAMVALGMVFRPQQPPEALLATARSAEGAGLDQLWVWEDCFCEGGIASAAAALGATERLAVGIGVLPVPLRNVALTAMELATLDRVYPGRLVAGVGHGVQDWMEQVGARAASPLTLLREYTAALRGLLAGETVTVDGDHVRLHGVWLSWPPLTPMRLHLAGEGPRTLDLVGAVADGLVVPGGYEPGRLRAVVDRVSAAAERAGRDRAPEVTVFLPCAFGPEGARRVAEERAGSGIPAEAPPAEVWGEASRVAEGVAGYLAAGADAVALLPVAADRDPGAFAAQAGEVATLVRGR